MGRSGSVEFSGVDVLAKSIEQHDRVVKRAILGVFKYTEGDAVTYAKSNAPWTDRTGNARAGLHSGTNILNGGNSFELFLAHSVYYGFWLEVRFSGKFAIIMPTINVIGTLLVQRLADTISKLEAA